MPYRLRLNGIDIEADTAAEVLALAAPPTLALEPIPGPWPAPARLPPPRVTVREEDAVMRDAAARAAAAARPRKPCGVCGGTDHDGRRHNSGKRPAAAANAATDPEGP
jgi:hypothetical protein